MISANYLEFYLPKKTCCRKCTPIMLCKHAIQTNVQQGFAGRLYMCIIRNHVANPKKILRPEGPTWQPI